MALSTQEVIHRLSSIEPSEVTEFNQDDAGVLEGLIAADDSFIAARAVHALAAVGAAGRAVRAAAQDPRPELRIAAARLARRLPDEDSSEILASLLNDLDAGVRKFAVLHSAGLHTDQIANGLDRLAGSDPNLRIRSLAADSARPQPDGGGHQS